MTHPPAQKFEGNQRETTSWPCLLCGRPVDRVVSQLNGGQLRRAWEALGHRLSPVAFGAISPEAVIQLRACSGCGFTFCDPALAGSEQFYRELEHASYFPPAKPEFSRTLEFAKRNNLKRVLDVGCGDGAFLDLAARAGMQTHGLEFNRAAVEKTRAKGHRVWSELLDQLSVEQTGGKFDLITLFQVVEHVSDPVGLMNSARRFLAPGGFISIAVPSAQGVYRLVPFDPHQWPPHHISRWRIADFRNLSAKCGLKLAEAGGEPLLGWSIEHFWNTHNQLALALGYSPRPGGRLAPQAVGWLYRKLGLKWVFPRWGNSIYAFFQLP